MGKKTLKTDEFDFDSELDFDFGDFDQDQGISKESKNSKPRSPITEVAKGVVSGAKSKLTDPSYVRRVAEKALPKQYGEIFDKVDKVAGASAALYDDAVKEIKPVVGKFAAKLNKLVPEERKTLKKVTSWLNDKVGESGSSHSGQSKEEMEEESISQSLNAVFSQQQNLQADAEARANAREDIRDNIEHKKFRSTISALNSINQHVSRVAQYTEKVTQPYQRKSLELQFRSFFLQKEQFKLAEKTFEVFKAQNESIVKNTALPEFVKITNSERWQDHAKNRIIEKGMNMFGGSKFVGKVKDRIKSKINEKVRSVKGAFGAGIEGIEGIEGLKEQNEMLAEAGMEGESTASMAGNLAAGGWLESKVNTAGKWLKENVVDKNNKVVKFGNKWATIAGNLPNEIYDLGNNKKLRDMEYEGGVKGWLAETIRNASSLFQDSPDTTISKNEAMDGISAPATFTNKFMLTVNDVIPGYLARINQGITALVTGDKNTELLLYDFKKSEFNSKSTTKSILTNRLKKSASDSRADYQADRGYEKIFGKDSGHSDDQKAKLKDFMFDVSTKQMKYSAENIRDTEEYRNLDDETRKIIDEKLAGSEVDSDDGTKLKYDLSKALVRVRESIPSIYGELKEMIQEGYGDILVEEGIIKKKSNGDYEIIEDKAMAFIKEHSLKRSDVNVKKNIKRINPRNALNAIRKTPVKQWTYKDGEGDGGEHIGPMAQTVNQNFGEDTAPGKKTIDLVSLNGATMSAIQALDEKIEKSDIGTANKTLLLIKKDTGALVSISREAIKMAAKQPRGTGQPTEGSNGHDGTVSGMVGSIIHTSINLAGNLGKTFLGGAGTVLSTAGKGIKALGEGMSSIFDKNKDRLKNTFTGLFDGALKFSKKVFDFTSNVLFDKLPAGWNWAAKKLTQAKDFIVNKFKELTDVYVKGRAEPALRATLLKMDYYRDSVTGKYIHTLEDLQSLKGDVLDKSGNVVLTMKEMADGVFDNKGQEIKNLISTIKDKIVDGLKGGYDRLKNFGKGIKDFFMSDKTKEMKDNIVNKIKGTTFPSFQIASTNMYRVLFDIRRIIAQKFRIKVNNEGLTDPVSVKITASASKLKDKLSEKLKDFKIPSLFGMKDKLKEEINAWKNRRDFEKSDSFMGPVRPDITDKATGIYQSLKDKIANAKDKLNETKDSLVDKKNEIADRYNYQKSDEFVGPQHQSLKGKIRGKFGILKSLAQNAISNPDKDNPEFVGPHQPTMKEKAKGFAEKLKAKAQEKIDRVNHQESEEFVGPKQETLLGKAKRRMGDWRDRLDKESENEKKRDKGFVKADDTPRYMNAVGNVMDLIKTGLGSAFDKVSGFFDFAENFMSKSKLFKVLKTRWNVAKGVGRGALTVGRWAMTAAKYARPALAVASALTGGAGAALMAGATAALSGVVAVIGSPVILATAALAITGYVGYKAIKKHNQNKVDDFGKIRARQYGLRFDGTDDSHADEIIQLENYLLEKSVGYSNGQAYLIDTNVKPDEMLAIFKIDKKDSKYVEKFTTWFQNRFKPFFLTHLTALYGIDDKKKLHEIRDLEVSKQIEFLNAVSYESGPYNEDTSPFKDVDGLEVNNEPVQNAIKILTEEIKKNVKKDEKKITADAAKAKAIEEKAKAAANAAGAISVTNRDFKPSESGANTSNTEPVGSDLVGKTSINPNGGDGLVGQGTGDGVKPTPKPSADSSESGSSTSAPTKSASGPMVDGSMAKQYIKNQGAQLDGINPSMLKNFFGMIQEYGEKTGKKVIVTSGYRSYEQQAKLFKEKPGLAAPPGRSMHEKGLAIDADSKDLNALEKEGLMTKYGFVRPVGGEPWHMEPVGIQGNYAKARNDPLLAMQMVDAGVGKGGGGIGAKPGSKKGSRDSASSVKQLGVKVTDDLNKATDVKPNPVIQAEVKKAETEKAAATPEIISKETSAPTTEVKVADKPSENKVIPTGKKATPGSILANVSGPVNLPSIKMEEPKSVTPALPKVNQQPTSAPVMEYKQPTPKPVVAPPVINTGPTLKGSSDIMTISSGVTTITETLTKSLVAQETMVELLKKLVSSLSPEAFADLLTKVTPQPTLATAGGPRTTPPSSKTPSAAVDLKRKEF